ncbi:DUF6862 domain-containing protein [Xenorhabdus indica]|uniref:DUF6862 domain-containing protein n=1 Tax=Xenorhabdus indica TaxID=333964 RepID=UPI0016573A2F|nr:hypothetical protein [Xenorhabdus indica]MBC8947018.1 hypothetical protein [Xenorhabdus indica]
MKEEQLSKKQAEGTLTESEHKELTTLKKESQSRDERLMSACQGSLSANCLREQKLAIEAQKSYQGYAEYQTYYDVLNQYPDEMAKFGQLINDYSHDIIRLVEKGYTPEQVVLPIVRYVFF